MTDAPALTQRMTADGYALVDAARMREILVPYGQMPDWPAFAATWADMPRDTYMADGGRYRRRRHAVFAALAGDPAIIRAPHRPHYQARDYNALNGGIARMFAAIEDTTATSQTLATLLAFTRALFDALQPDTSWDIELHQFRIIARAGVPGQPTPEGLHRDGVDYALVLLIDRVNIERGTTTIHALDKTLLGSFTLTRPLDAALVHDRDVFHGVTAVEPVDPAMPAYRDVLVLTFRAV